MGRDSGGDRTGSLHKQYQQQQRQQQHRIYWVGKGREEVVQKHINLLKATKWSRELEDPCVVGGGGGRGVDGNNFKFLPNMQVL